MNRWKIKSFVALLVCFFIVLGCTKTYEDGPLISLRTKKNRITGKWKLVNVEGRELLEPNTDMFMELTNEKVAHRLEIEQFRAVFVSFQFPHSGNTEFDTTRQVWEATRVDRLLSEEGVWRFDSGTFPLCEGDELRDEEVDEKEGIGMGIDNDNVIVAEYYKILRLTNKELVLHTPRSCYYNDALGKTTLHKETTWHFEKVK